MAATNQKTILVIDDDIDLQKLLKLKLGQKGFQVITADNGEAGLDMLEQCTQLSWQSCVTSNFISLRWSEVNFMS